jgi:hypothetical protein
MWTTISGEWSIVTERVGCIVARFESDIVTIYIDHSQDVFMDS